MLIVYEFHERSRLKGESAASVVFRRGFVFDWLMEKEIFPRYVSSLEPGNRKGIKVENAFRVIFQWTF